MQGLFGRFGKKNPRPEVSPANPRPSTVPSKSDIDDREFPLDLFDLDDEETNWDDAETLADENNPIVYAQPIVPVVTTPTAATTPDLEDWDEALPAATVKNSNVQEVRRGKNAGSNAGSVAPTEDIWDENLPSPRFSPNTSQLNLNVPTTQKLGKRSIPNPVEGAIGFWSAIVNQFRQVLPAPIRQIPDPIVTAIIVAIVTITIWFIDGFFMPGVDPMVANSATPIIAGQPRSTEPQISPEQAFFKTIQTQLSDITSQYPDDIIQTLSVDIAGDRLIIRLNPIWYQISDDRQNSLTDRMWLQAQANHFTKLEIQDTQGISIARSPVVGKHPIILQRRQRE
jgi:hypothetical protein